MIYFDHAATTPMRKEVQTAMEEYFSKNFGNPSSIHQIGQNARMALDQASYTISNILNCSPQEIIFTSGGTESNNLAIQGLCKAKGSGHIITSQIEHPSIYKTLQHLEKEGFSVTYLPVDRDGEISLKDVEKAVQEDTILISIHYTNNEIGTIQEVTKIGRIAEKHSIPFHIDAVQAAAFLDISVNKLKCTMLSLSAHKLYGPKGIGLLYKKANTALTPLFFGGGQEHQLRSGTENIPGIIGFAKALELIEEEKEKLSEHTKYLRDIFIQEIQKEIPAAFVNGPKDPEVKLPNNANICFPEHNGESLLIRLDMAGICASMGSACSSGSLDASPTLLALGLTQKEALSSLRFSFGRDNTKEEVIELVKKLKEFM